MEEFRIIGGHVALDLVNTAAPRPAVATEWLGAPASLLHWAAARVALITAGEAAAVSARWDAAPASADQALHATLDIRESLCAVLTAGPGGAAPELERLTLRWSAATARSRLRLGGPGEPSAVLDVDPAGAMLIPDRLIHAAVEFLRTTGRDQVRSCPVGAGGCGWLFLDRSRNHSRRWCTMEDCGAHAKSRRLTARRRAERTATIK